MGHLCLGLDWVRGRTVYAWARLNGRLCLGLGGVLARVGYRLAGVASEAHRQRIPGNKQNRESIDQLHLGNQSINFTKVSVSDDCYIKPSFPLFAIPKA